MGKTKLSERPGFSEAVTKIQQGLTMSQASIYLRAFRGSESETRAYHALRLAAKELICEGGNEIGLMSESTGQAVEPAQKKPPVVRAKFVADPVPA